MRDDGATADPPIAHAKVQTLAAAKRRATPALLIDMIASIHGDLSITFGTLDSVRYRECEVRHITMRTKTESKKYRTRFGRRDAPGTFYDRRSRRRRSGHWSVIPHHPSLHSRRNAAAPPATPAATTKSH